MVLVTHDTQVSGACTRVLSMLDGEIRDGEITEAGPEDSGVV